MFRNLFSQISEINTLPIAVMIFFFLFFIGVIIMAFLLDKKTETIMSNMPLQKDCISNIEQNTH
ncbi:MAG: CcoQ/FixQ family Cbb3-type cytochrome c oxidase assembly chaperone [Candidatus Kapaibacteriota bacterium]|jgi:cbb3-type cytochrome oxidase subunit 3